MSVRREPSEPPVIPGFVHRGLAGVGGFADVFLYEQQLPRRLVAVKVLLASSLSDAVREQFRAEANLMAQLSQHPSILTVLQADVANDGRPYLVMEHCSRPGLGARYRGERMPVAEVLRIGVRLAGAVETAHRAGILHRDIKPANVLVTDFGWPALTDFGIAATTAGGRAIGMSIPWCGPELFADPPVADVRTDVYGLAATLYALLAGRSPYEGGDASPAELIRRVEQDRLPPVGRPDVPAALDEALAGALSKAPADRPASAAALGRQLQAVERALHLPETPLDLPATVFALEASAGGGDEPAELTRMRPVVAVDPRPRQLVPPAGERSSPVPVSSVDAGQAPAVVTTTPEPPPAGHPEADWWEPAGAATAPRAAAAGGRGAGRRRRSPRIWATVLAGAVVVGGTALVATAVLGGDVVDPRPTSSGTPTGSAAVLPVPSPVDLLGRRLSDGEVIFRWDNPDPQDGDQFVWSVVATGTEPVPHLTGEPVARVEGGAGEVCVEVVIRRADGRASTSPAAGCVG